MIAFLVFAALVRGWLSCDSQSKDPVTVYFLGVQWLYLGVVGFFIEAI